MRIKRITTRKPGLGSAIAAAFGLVVMLSACSGGGTGESEVPSPAVEASSAETSDTAASNQAAGPTEMAGELVIDGQSYALAKTHWCEPEPEFKGSTVVLRVVAYDESEDVIIHGMNIERGDDPSSALLTIATDPNTNYSSEGLKHDPMIVMQDGVVRLQGRVYRPGQDPVDVEAEFSLPAKPGLPGYC